MHAIVDGLGFILPYRKTSKTAPFFRAVSSLLFCQQPQGLQVAL